MNNNTSELWIKLKKMGNFSDRYYDYNILEDLKKELSVGENFDVEIKNISPEKLLMSFFKVLSPLVDIYADILDLFKRCQATSGYENVEIEFDAGRFKSERISIDHFIHAKEILGEIKCVTNKKELSRKATDILWKLLNKKSIFLNYTIQNDKYKIWKAEYEDKRRWPKQELDFMEIINNSSIKEKLSEAYIFWEELFQYCKDTKIGREEWSLQVLNMPEIDKNDKDLLIMEADGCVRDILKNLYCLAENYDNFSKSEKNIVEKELDDFLNEYISKNKYEEVIIPQWQTFLRLPIWKKRYEVYSVWVFYEMISTFSDDEIVFHLKDNVLSFPFSGACIASILLYGKKFDIWTELRFSTFVKPCGKGRTRAIQPDYSIVYENKKTNKDSIVVVECKQYKRASMSNFSQAIIDYALNCPNAEVFLADYGDINQTLLESKLEMLSSEQYTIMPHFRPDTSKYQGLSNKIRNIIYKKLELFVFEKKDIGFFSLTWNEISNNLYLCLIFRNEDNSEKKIVGCDFNNFEDVTYTEDVTDKYRTQNIIVKKWKGGIYDLVVLNCSQNYNLSQSNAVVNVLFQGSNRVVTVNMPSNGSEYGGCVLRINTREYTIKIIN